MTHPRARLPDRPVGRDQRATAGRLGMDQFKLVGAASPGNSRLRPPPTTGLITKVSSSRSPASMSDRISAGLPVTPDRAAVLLAQFPDRVSHRALDQGTVRPVIDGIKSGRSGVLLRTADPASFRRGTLANGSTVDVGQ